jgi:hypothetical protein
LLFRNRNNPLILKREFAAVSNEELKQAIMEKFGNLAQFCRLTGRKLAELHQNLRYRTEHSTAYLAGAFADAGRLANTEAVGYHFTPELRKRLSGKLMAYPNILAFCESHKTAEGKPEFSNVFVSRAINGTILKITPKVKRLAEALHVEIS